MYSQTGALLPHNGFKLVTDYTITMTVGAFLFAFGDFDGKNETL